MAQKVLKNAKTACSRLGQYRMPFAWSARYKKTLLFGLGYFCYQRLFLQCDQFIIKLT